MDTLKLHVAENGETTDYYMTGMTMVEMNKQVRTARGSYSGKGDAEFWLDAEDFAKVRRATRCTISTQAPAPVPAGVRPQPAERSNRERHDDGTGEPAD